MISNQREQALETYQNQGDLNLKVYYNWNGLPSSQRGLILTTKKTRNFNHEEHEEHEDNI